MLGPGCPHGQSVTLHAVKRSVVTGTPRGAPGYMEPSICLGTRAKSMRSKAESREAFSGLIGRPKPCL
jgi:hypothetical protein